MTDAYLDPTREIFAELKKLTRDHPVDMLNLVSLREHAAYGDGRDVTGAEAYAVYGRESGPIFRKVGGEIIWSGEPQFVVIGPQSEQWDVAFIARYPTGQAFLDMVYDPDYQAVVHHRQAAVRTSRLIRMRPRASGAGFG
ncbi:MAG: DUF1330 domain-containing protein [Inquilinus sp.]|nr:DUF1330 domain-containing protein [Inquilinus sp.]